MGTLQNIQSNNEPEGWKSPEEHKTIEIYGEEFVEKLFGDSQRELTYIS